jgi:hypothetical protein
MTFIGEAHSKKINKNFCGCFTDRGGFYKKSPWPPEAKTNICHIVTMKITKTYIYDYFKISLREPQDEFTIVSKNNKGFSNPSVTMLNAA